RQQPERGQRSWREWLWRRQRDSWGRRQRSRDERERGERRRDEWQWHRRAGDRSWIGRTARCIRRHLCGERAMTPAVAFLLLLAATVVWALLPLLPAFIETVRPSDAHPLADVGRDAGDLRTFAEGFRRYLNGQLPEGRSLGDLSFHGRDRLRDGTP